MNKYRAKKVKYFGLTFDSKKEGLRYLELKNMEQKGTISNLETQKRFELIPKQGNLRKCEYIADFVYNSGADGSLIVEDVKGYKKGCAFQLYTIKKKLMKHVYNIDVVEV